MGEIADYYAEEYYKDIAMAQGQKQQMKTEDILNRKAWVDAYGTVHELENMDRDYLQNVLFFIYKRRDRYWLNCRDVSLIEKFKDGDEFFQHVIRNSTIWKSIIAELEKPVEGFNFEFTIPGEETK